LFTLENSVEMTWDRIACMATGVEYGRWQAGTCDPEAVEAVVAFHRDEVLKSDVPFYVLKPEMDRRTFESMIRESQVRDIQSLFVDQLTHVELPSPRKNKSERVGEALQLAKGMISTSRSSMSLTLAHQIKREGMREAEKVGYHRMSDFADSADVERTTDMAFALYASADDKLACRMKFLTLAARRFEDKHWEMDWMPYVGYMRVRSEITL